MIDYENQLYALLGPGATFDAALARAASLAHDGERRRLVHWYRRLPGGADVDVGTVGGRQNGLEGYA